LLFHKLPQPLNEVQVGRVSRSVPPRDAERVSDGLHQRTTLGARIVQDQGDGHLSTQGPQLPQSLADTLSIDVREVGDGYPLMRDGMECPEHLETLPPAGRFDPTLGAAPEIPKKRPEDTRRHIHKKDGTLTRLCFGSAWLHLFFDTLPAHRGRLWLTVCRPCDGGARGE
jgi:hypothetical protein